MRLSDIRKSAPQVWRTSGQFISYPELMQALDPESIAVSDYSILEEQYSYIVNTILLDDYLRHINQLRSTFQP